MDVFEKFDDLFSENSPEDYPTEEEWNDKLIPKIKIQILDYLSNPDMWSDEIEVDGKKPFYDPDTCYRDMRRSCKPHLIECWDVECYYFENKLKVHVDNYKYVKGQDNHPYRLLEMLKLGTDSYEMPEDVWYSMRFWDRYKERWNKTRKRKGIRGEFGDKLQMLINEAVDYGVSIVIKEWFDEKEE